MTFVEIIVLFPMYYKMSSVLEMISKNPVGTGEGRSQQFTAQVHCDLSLWRPRVRVGKYTEMDFADFEGNAGIPE